MRVTALNVFPVKSCAGIALDAARLTPTGLADDRHWMIVDDKGVFISQREVDTLAKILVTVDDTALHLACDGDTFSVPRDVTTFGPRERLTVSVWSDTFRALSYPAKVGVDDWLSNVLSRPVRLIEDDGDRPLKETVQVAGYFGRMAFADGYPMLILSEESLADLNQRIRARRPDHIDVPMNRFRPNVVIEGGGPYCEDAHRYIHIGETKFLGGKPCARCVIITIDQQTLVTSKEPLATLATYRREDGEVMFGQNLRVPVISGAPITLRVGDPVAFED